MSENKGYGFSVLLMFMFFGFLLGMMCTYDVFKKVSEDKETNSEYWLEQCANDLKEAYTVIEIREFEIMYIDQELGLKQQIEDNDLKNKSKIYTDFLTDIQEAREGVDKLYGS